MSLVYALNGSRCETMGEFNATDACHSNSMFGSRRRAQQPYARFGTFHIVNNHVSQIENWLQATSFCYPVTLKK